MNLNKAETITILDNAIKTTHRTAVLQLALWKLAESLDEPDDHYLASLEATWLTRPCSECETSIQVDLDINTEPQYCSVCSDVFFGDENF